MAWLTSVWRWGAPSALPHMLWTQYVTLRGWELNLSATPIPKHHSGNLTFIFIPPSGSSPKNSHFYIKPQLSPVIIAINCFISCLFCTVTRIPRMVLLEGASLTPDWFPNVTPGGSIEWRFQGARREAGRGGQLAEAQTNSGPSSPPWASLFCCCFAGVQGCAMNWAAANSHQFVRSSLTVIWEEGAR